MTKLNQILQVYRERPTRYAWKIVPIFIVKLLAVDVTKGGISNLYVVTLLDTSCHTFSAQFVVQAPITRIDARPNTQP